MTKISSVLRERAQHDGLTLGDWRSKVVDVRAGIEQQTIMMMAEDGSGATWRECAPPDPTLQVNACNCTGNGWHVVTNIDEADMSAEAATALGAALSTAAAQCTALNATAVHGVSSSAEEAAALMGQVVPVFAMIDDSGYLAVRIDSGAWARNCRVPGDRWSFGEFQFLFIDRFRVVGFSGKSIAHLAAVDA